MILAALPGVPGDIQLLCGPLLLGYLFNWGLYGVLCMQMYMYFLGFPGDLTGVKTLVYSLFAIDTIQTAMTTHNAWHFLVSGWGDPEVLLRPGWSWIAVPLLDGVVSCVVQIFFAWRIYKISGTIWIPIPILLVALTQGICACITAIWFEIIDDVTKIGFLDPTATVWLGGSALADILIAVTMVVLLRKSSTGFSGTDQIIRRLIRMTVETGSLTAFCAVMELFLFLKWKENNMHMIPALALSKLYSNTLIATLNSRNPQYRSSQREETETNGLHFRTTIGGTTSKVMGDHLRSTHQATKVQITTHQETHREDGIAMHQIESKTDADDDSQSVVKVGSDMLSANDFINSASVEELDSDARRYWRAQPDNDVEYARGAHPYIVRQ